MRRLEVPRVVLVVWGMFCLCLLAPWPAVAMVSAPSLAMAGVDNMIDQLWPRQSSTDMDFSGMPGCSANLCLSRYAFLGCGNVPSKDCYCGRPDALACAWSVDWSCWNSTESWYSTACPPVPLIDTSKIPSCATKCFKDANPCYVNTRNCVCSMPKPFCGGTGTCPDLEGRRAYEAWYSESCLYNTTDISTTASYTTTATTTSASASSSGTSSANPSSSTTTVSSPAKEKKKTPVGLITGAAVGASAVLVMIILMARYLLTNHSKPKYSPATTTPDNHGGAGELDGSGRAIGELYSPPVVVAGHGEKNGGGGVYEVSGARLDGEERRMAHEIG